MPPHKNKRSYGAAEEPTKRRMGFRTRRNLVFAAVLGAALLAAALVVSSKGANETDSLLSVIGPGTHLELQTSSGPMSLTVDSAMNSEGYVHAHGTKNGVTYAGFVKLTASNPAALQADEASPTPQQLAVFPQQQQQMQPSQLQQQQTAMGGAAQGGTQVLDISRQGAVTIDGEPVVAANTRTAAVLRLLAKRAAGRSSNMFGGASDLGREIDRSSAIVSHLDGRRRSTSGNKSDGTRQAIWAAMQTLMRTVSKIEKKQDKMGQTVERVRRVMRYRP